MSEAHTNQIKKFHAKTIDYRRTFESEHGKRVLHDLMVAGHVLGSAFVKGDPHESSHREGERNLVLRILSILKVDPNKLEQLAKEQGDVR